MERRKGKTLQGATFRKLAPCVMTTCKDAITLFVESEARNPDKLPAEEARHVRATPTLQCQILTLPSQVKLYFMKPPIKKLDPAALAVLKATLRAPDPTG